MRLSIFGALHKLNYYLIKIKVWWTSRKNHNMLVLFMVFELLSFGSNKHWIFKSFCWMRRDCWAPISTNWMDKSAILHYRWLYCYVLLNKNTFSKDFVCFMHVCNPRVVWLKKGMKQLQWSSSLLIVNRKSISKNVHLNSDTNEVVEYLGPARIWNLCCCCFLIL